MKRVYHGWIYIQKTEGMTDAFYVMPIGEKSHYVGNGNEGAEKSVAFFDEKCGCPVKLDNSMGFLGLRVYTEVESEDDK